jgi:hypothetical protein
MEEGRTAGLHRFIYAVYGGWRESLVGDCYPFGGV